LVAAECFGKRRSNQRSVPLENMQYCQPVPPNTKNLPPFGPKRIHY